MRGLTRRDALLLAVLLPIWLAGVVLHVDRLISDLPLAWFPAYLAPAPAGAHPTVLSLWPGVPADREDVLRPGDRLLGVGDGRSLADATRLDVIQSAYLAAQETDTGRSVPFTVARHGSSMRARLPLQLVPYPESQLFLAPMRLTTIFSLCLLLAGSAGAADMQSVSFSLRGGHVNGGSNALLQSASPSSTGLGSAGATVGGGVSHGDSVGASLSVAGGYWAVESALAAAVFADADTDGDGIPDAMDNCLYRPNPDQLDVDLDGYGNVCDADLTNNAVVDLPDMGAVLSTLGSTTDPHNDITANDVVDLPDLGRILSDLGLYLSGESGLSCAGTTPCTSDQ